MFFSLIISIKKKIKNYVFFIWNQFLIFLLLILFNLIFFFLGPVFITLSWLFFYSFFVLCIILSTFFFRIIFFCFLQDFLSIKPVIIQYYTLIWQLIKKIFILLIHNFILISHFSFTIIFLNFYFYLSAQNLFLLIHTPSAIKFV